MIPEKVPFIKDRTAAGAGKASSLEELKHNSFTKGHKADSEPSLQILLELLRWI